MAMHYGFYEECLRKYAGSSVVWEHCSKVFDHLSLAALIGDRVFCVHGGLSPSVVKVNSINSIKKQEIQANSPESDLVWSDPSECNGWAASLRGSGFLYGPDVVQNFLHANNLNYICRAHQLCMNGYSWNNDHTVLTIFSAPNYCYQNKNVAAIAEINAEMTLNIQIFNAAPTCDRGAPYRVPAIYFED